MRWCLVALIACGNAQVTGDAAAHVVTADPSITLGGVIEGRLAGGAGDSVRIVLSSAAPFDWNLHTHVGGTQVIQQASQVMVADYTYTPTETGTWNLTLLNNGSAPTTVHVALSLFGDMQWSGF